MKLFKRVLFATLVLALTFSTVFVSAEDDGFIYGGKPKQENRAIFLLEDENTIQAPWTFCLDPRRHQPDENNSGKYKLHADISKDQLISLYAGTREAVDYNYEAVINAHWDDLKKVLLHWELNVSDKNEANYEIAQHVVWYIMQNEVGNLTDAQKAFYNEAKALDQDPETKAKLDSAVIDVYESNEPSTPGAWQTFHGYQTLGALRITDDEDEDDNEDDNDNEDQDDEEGQDDSESGSDEEGGSDSSSGSEEDTENSDSGSQEDTENSDSDSEEDTENSDSGSEDDSEDSTVEESAPDTSDSSDVVLYLVMLLASTGGLVTIVSRRSRN